MVMKFICGFCKPNKKYIGTRKGLRKHLREEHRIMNEITNRENIQSGKKSTQSWWKREEFK